MYPQPLHTASQVRMTSRSWDKGVLTDLCLTRVLTDLCLTLYNTINRTVVLGWYDFNTCIIQHFGMVNIKFNLKLCKQPHSTLFENHHPNGCGSGWIISWTLCWTLPISEIWLITRRFGNICVIFKWSIIMLRGLYQEFRLWQACSQTALSHTHKRDCTSALCTRVKTLIVAAIYLQLIQNRYMFRSFTVLQCSHQHCVQPVASDVEVVGYL